MNNIVFILVLVFSTLSAFVSPATAETDTFARTTASDLNVRSIPNGKAVTCRLPVGSVVAILQTQGIWANIVYLEDNDPNKPKEGWVSAKYLRVLYKKEVGNNADSTILNT